MMSIEIGLLKSDFSRKAELETIVVKSCESKVFSRNSIIYVPSKKFAFLDDFSGLIHSISIGDIVEKTDGSNLQFFYFEFSEHLVPELEIMESHEEQITSSM